MEACHSSHLNETLSNQSWSPNELINAWYPNKLMMPECAATNKNQQKQMARSERDIKATKIDFLGTILQRSIDADQTSLLGCVEHGGVYANRYILRGLSSKLDGRLLASPVESALFLDVKPNASALHDRVCRLCARFPGRSCRGSRVDDP
jgi:hypothetical protein